MESLDESGSLSSQRSLEERLENRFEFRRRFWGRITINDQKSRSNGVVIINDGFFVVEVDAWLTDHLRPASAC